jgi:hypothetical protein
MKNFVKISVSALLAMSVIISCKKEDEKDTTTPPVITELTASMHGGSTKIKRGEEFSVDFKAESKNDGRLEKYHIEIHDHPASGKIDDEYRIIDSTFVNKATFKGTRNATVHEHITVPANANLGKYHVVVVIFDEYGNTADTENGDTEIEIVE